jgi:hypothetical protein
VGLSLVEEEVDYVALVTQMYLKYNPEKLEDPEFVANTLQRYKGHEKGLILAMQKKYRTFKNVSLHISRSHLAKGGKRILCEGLEEARGGLAKEGKQILCEGLR